jgi:hypothetical protein
MSSICAKGTSDVTSFGKLAVGSIFNETVQLYEGAVESITEGACFLAAKIHKQTQAMIASLSKGDLFVFSIKRDPSIYYI